MRPTNGLGYFFNAIVSDQKGKHIACYERRTKNLQGDQKPKGRTNAEK